MQSKSKAKPKRGEIWWVLFDLGLGSEIQKDRPAIVVSNDIFNRHTERFQVVPLTTNTDKLYPGEALVTVKKKKGKAMANQLATSSIKRFRKKYTQLSTSDMSTVERILKFQLGLDK